MTLALVLGGVRSGKSAHAERLVAARVASGHGVGVRYVATADPADGSMGERIARHRARRPPEWETVVAGAELAAALHPTGVTLLDGLGMWIAGALHRSGGDRDLVRGEIAVLAAAAADHELVVVAEQAGEGMLPLDPIARAWLDALGEATQALAARATQVELVVAGRVLALPAMGEIGDSIAHISHPTAGVVVAEDLGDLRVHGDAALTPGLRDHAVNVLAGGPPDWLRTALRRAVGGDGDEDGDGDGVLTRYPDERAATEALAALHGRDPAEVVITNGAAEALWLLPAALCPRLAACVHPGFTESEAALRAHGIPVARVHRDPDHGFALDPHAVPDAADLVIVGHPASPSGTLDPPAVVEALLRRPGRTVVVDEAFMSMVPGEPGSFAAGPHPGVIVVRSLTKLLAVPGLRVGYALAPAALAAALRAVRPPWSANALALAVIAAAAAHPDELAAAARRAAGEGADLVARLATVPGVRSWPTETNFALIEVPGGPAVSAALRARGFAVRHAQSFPGLHSGHIRVTARTPAENAELVDALAEALA